MSAPARADRGPRFESRCRSTREPSPAPRARRRSTTPWTSHRWQSSISPAPKACETSVSSPSSRPIAKITTPMKTERADADCADRFGAERADDQRVDHPHRHPAESPRTRPEPRDGTSAGIPGCSSRTEGSMGDVVMQRCSLYRSVGGSCASPLIAADRSHDDWRWPHHRRRSRRPRRCSANLSSRTGMPAETRQRLEANLALRRRTSTRIRPVWTRHLAWTPHRLSRALSRRDRDLLAGHRAAILPMPRMYRHRGHRYITVREFDQRHRRSDAGGGARQGPAGRSRTRRPAKRT